MTRSALLPALLAAVLTLVGCGGPEIVDPVYPIKEDEFLVVMPFKDPDFPSRWDSPRGHDLAAHTTEALSQKAEFGVRSYEQVIDLFRADDVKRLSPRDVAALTKSDYVLVVDVEKLELRDRGSVNVQRGTAKAKVRLFKVERRSEEEEAREAQRNREREEAARKAGIPTGPFDAGGRYVREDEVEAVFPSDYHTEYGSGFLEPGNIQDGLLGVLSRKVAKLYVEHEQEKIEVE